LTVFTKVQKKHTFLTEEEFKIPGGKISEIYGKKNLIILLVSKISVSEGFSNYF